MIAKKDIEDFFNDALQGTDAYLVQVSVSPANDIIVEIDSDTSVDVDFCAELSHRFNEAFDRDADDYSLEVGSAGFTAPFRVLRQWEKNLGNEIDLLTRDGRKFVATLDAVDADAAAITYKVKEKPEGAKRPVFVDKTERIPLADIKSASLHFTF